MRREVVAAKKQLARRRKWSCLVEAEKRYSSEVRTSYVTAIKNAKERSWKDFLERYRVAEGGPANPWGTLHRQVAGKTKKKVSFGSLERNDGSWTTSWKESAELLLERFFLSDEEDACDGSHQHIRELVKSYQNCNVESPVTREEIIRCLKRSKNSKAPGPDGVLYEHLKVVQGICPDSLAGLLNKYLYNRTYPVNWKVAKLAVILKGRGASLTKAGSYRPISLLSAMGKLYERILVSRVEQDYDARGLNSSSQFCFKASLSAEVVICKTLGTFKNKNKNFVLLLFIDIQGAFDNLWWLSILLRLIKVGISSYIFDTLKDYFSGRSVSLMAEDRSMMISREAERGCPQGSIVGPYAWRHGGGAWTNC